MKRLVCLLVLVSLLACERNLSGPESVQDTDAEVYKALLNFYHEYHKVNILLGDKTVNQLFSDGPFDYYYEKIPKLQKETMSDYVEKSAASSPLPDFSELDFVVVQEQGSEGSVPGSKCSLSKVGYNKSGTQAVVSFGENLQPMVATGYLCFLQLKGSEWVVTDMIVAWMS